MDTYRNVKYFYEGGQLLWIADLYNKASLQFTRRADGQVTARKFVLNGEVFQNMQASYDHANRLIALSDLHLTIQQFLDANNNVMSRKVDYNPASERWTDSILTLEEQHWNTFNRADRLMVMEGVLQGGNITISSGQGTRITYDSLTGGRVQDAYLSSNGQSQTRAYAYLDNGALRSIEASEDQMLKARQAQAN